jgi:F-type H+-transporting ATPase subunit b
MPQLDPSHFPTQLFWLFVTFAALFLISWKVALPRIAEVLNMRQNRIDSDLERAEALKSDAEEVLAAYKKVLADASAEAQNTHRQIVQELADERTRRQEELSQRLSGQTREAEDRIAGEKQRAVENIRATTLGVVQSAATRLIGVSVAEADADQAIRSTLEERRS